MVKPIGQVQDIYLKKKSNLLITLPHQTECKLRCQSFGHVGYSNVIYENMIAKIRHQQFSYFEGHA